MRPMKENEQEESDHAPEHGNAAPPAYDESWQGGSQAAAAATDSKRSHGGPQDAAEQRPTVESPFNFPPAYTPSASTSGSAEAVTPSGATSSSSSSSIPSAGVLLAVPQVAPQPTSPFLSAYSTAVLLRRGISNETFISFLSTLSAFLSATVSERALAHAGDVGRSLNDIPKKFSKDTLAHVKD
ncbi:hypothetical protein CHU98_g1386, partial [Xylaria longipes]